MIEKKKLNVLGLIGFIISIITLILCGVGSIVGLILSIIALATAKRKNKTTGLAIAGVIISSIGIVVFTILSIYSVLTSDTPSGKVNKQNKENKVCIYFYKDNYTQYDKKCILIGDKVTKPSDPSKNGYKFLYWGTKTVLESKAKEFDFNEPINSDIILYAEYEKIPYEETEEYKKGQEEKNKIQVTDVRGYLDEYELFYYIEGKLINNKMNYSYIDISFNVYDSSGNVIGSCYDNQTNLNKGETWSFKTICSGEASSVASYKLIKYDGF